MGFLKEIDGKIFIFQSKPMHVTPQIDCLGKMSTVLRVSIHIYNVSKDIGRKNVHFLTKPRHVTPQINHLGKTSTVLRVSTHIYEISKEIDGKTFIFGVNQACDPSNHSSWKNEHCS